VNGEGTPGANGEGAPGANREGALKVNGEGALKVGGSALAGESMDAVRACRKGLVVCVKGHPSVSLLPLSSPTLYLFICIPPPHLCTIFKDHTYSRQLLSPMV
jgi:hypothetical protein